jgi:sialate O-acetylesterase
MTSRTQRDRLWTPMVFLAAAVGPASLPTRCDAAVKLPPVLSSHMVLQREMPVPIWGTAAPGEKVTVVFRQQRKNAVAGKDGRWAVKLAPLQAGGPDTLTVSGGNTLTLDDVLVGEVWLGSGQSNMQMAVGAYTAGDAVLAKMAAAGPYPRLRLIRSGSPGWQEATRENIDGFSALLFSFGRPLQKDLGVPVGLIVGAVGGTPSGRWLSEEAYASDEVCKEAIKRFAATYSAEHAEKQYERELLAWQRAVKAAKENQKLPRKPELALRPGEVRIKIGDLYSAYIRPFIPYAIRGVLWDQGENGTAVGGVDQDSLMGALVRGWRSEWGEGDFPFLYVQKPSGGGCAWDNSDPVTLRADRFSPLPHDPPSTEDGLYRETHIRIRHYPHTAMVTSSDLGGGIHPVNKSGYGARACRVALGMVYGRKVEIYGPVRQSYKIEGRKVRISFTHVGQGLAFRPPQPRQGFALAGADQVFHWADAVIDGDTVVVSSDRVVEPVAVRYAWGRSHSWANLFNKDGLPALPFRTDSW